MIAIVSLLLILGGCSSTVQKVSLEEQFINPSPGESDPWTFWYWMYGVVSKEGITADLEAMKNIGLGGAYLMPIRSDAENKTF
ncbi:MAG: glycosyl hydrolase, partial [Fermentimonas sp.]|nr:glycosyl hydrolase [Fermentimonas sp.]